MNDHFSAVTLTATNASALEEAECLQNLWSGYGRIVRCRLKGSEYPSVVVKHVKWPTRSHHPCGWDTGRSHERKVRSYQVESTFYETYAERCGISCRIPQCLALESHGDEVFMVFEDLDAAGFSGRRRRIDPAEIRSCLAWLAHFHATFLGETPKGLWETGTYWHLETRPDELAALEDVNLRKAAPAIDRKLRECRFQTFVHGDAKLANFCFSPDGSRVAAIDFQYVGGGCGMKDVAYFLDSCLPENECERQETELLDFYFGELRNTLTKHDIPVDFPALEQEWRNLYPVAWTDFYRFLHGWSPGQWPVHAYSRRLVRKTLESL